MVTRNRLAAPLAACLAAGLFTSCTDSQDASGRELVDYRIAYDIEGKEIDAPAACRTAVLALENRPALDSFIARWTIPSDRVDLGDVNFDTTRVLGLVMGQSPHAPAALQVESFREEADSLRLSLVSGCGQCLLDSHSGDVLILTYRVSTKPLAVTLNGKAKPMDDSVRVYRPAAECSGPEP